MPRTARIVFPGIPHHVTQRGSRRERTFFSPADHRYFRRLLATAAAKCGTEVWAYCFMPNHFHLIAAPRCEVGLRHLLAEPSRRYALEINARYEWSGHLWQSRYASVALDEAYLTNAVRYVSLNPVRAGLVQQAEDWPWSSVRAHLAGQDNELVRVEPVLSRIPNFRTLLEVIRPDREFTALRQCERSNAPLDGKSFRAHVLDRGDS
jgi:putative transposase